MSFGKAFVATRMIIPQCIARGCCALSLATASSRLGRVRLPFWTLNNLGTPCGGFAEFDFQEYMMDKAAFVNQALDDSLPMDYPENVHEVRKYNLMGTTLGRAKSHNRNVMRSCGIAV